MFQHREGPNSLNRGWKCPCLAVWHARREFPHLPLVQQPQTHSILPHAHESARPINGIKDPVAALHRGLRRFNLYTCWGLTDAVIEK